MGWILYSTVGCHLCEDAMALIGQSRIAGQVREIDIADDDDLLARYGIRIPVLRHETSGAELGWPFDAPALARFIAACA